MDAPPCMCITLDELRYAVGILFLITHKVKYLITSHLSFSKSFATQLLPHLFTVYGDVDFFSICPHRNDTHESRALRFWKTDDANHLFFVWIKATHV
eukprot:248519-Pleurochrysis_carterae.AAC.2